MVNDKIHRLIGTALGIKPSRQWKDTFFVQDDVFGLIVDDVVNLSSKQSVSNSTISCFYRKTSLKILLQQFHRIESFSKFKQSSIKIKFLRSSFIALSTVMN